jgi:hypothetical protein
MPDPRRQVITQALMRHGHYDLIEVEPDCVVWALHDADTILGCPVIDYANVDAALLDTGLHDPEECNDACVRDVLEALGAR